MPLVKEYALNYSRIPNMTQGIFLSYGILESLGNTEANKLQALFLRAP